MVETEISESSLVIGNENLREEFEQAENNDGKFNQKSSAKSEKFAEYEQDLMEEVEEQFEKVFSFHKPSRGAWSLPPVKRVFADIRMDSVPPVWADLLVLKEELNDLKSHLNDKEITTWRKHTQQQHLGGDVVQHLKGTVNPDLCTQAWTKLHEVLFQFDIVPKEGSSFKSVHLCEAPGAFISSVNHFIKTHRKNLQWFWWATTLNPYYEGNDLDVMIADDRVLSLTLPNWYFGIDDTGNCMDVDNMFGLVNFIGHEVDFVTADGSINCQDKPDEQESIVIDLHYCEILTALSLLAPGGKFVLKVFTFFEHASVCMIYLLNAVFNEVHIFKPSTSKPGNSELYIVCLDYIGRTAIKDYLPVFHKNFSENVFDSRNLFFVDDIPKSFIDELQDCAYMFTTLQSETIRRNISLFENPSVEDVQRANKGRELCTFMWTDKMDVKYIRDTCRLHPGLKFKSQNFTPYYSTRQTGNFYERLEQMGLPWRQRIELERPEVYLKKVLPKVPRVNVDWLQDGRSMGFVSDYKNWRPVYGKQLSFVKNSKYCLPQLLKEVNEALNNCRFLKNPDELHDFKLDFLLGNKDQQYKDFLSQFQKDLVVKLKSMKNCRALLLRGKLIFQALKPAFGSETNHSMFILEHHDKSTTVKQVPKEKMEPLGTQKHVETGGGDFMKKRAAPYSSVDDNFNLAPLAEPSLKMQALSAVDALGVDLVMMDISSDVYTVGNFAEIFAKSEFLTAVLLALKSLQVGGTLLLGIDEMLTRFDVCIFYILVRLFRKVSIVQVSHSVTCSGRLLVGYQYNGISDGLVKYLSLIGENLYRRRAAPKNDVLQFVDHVLITDASVTSYLCSKNNAHLYRLLSAVVEYEKTQNPLKICSDQSLNGGPQIAVVKPNLRRAFTSSVKAEKGHEVAKQE